MVRVQSLSTPVLATVNAQCTSLTGAGSWMMALPVSPWMGRRPTIMAVCAGNGGRFANADAPPVEAFGAGVLTSRDSTGLSWAGAGACPARVGAGSGPGPGAAGPRDPNTGARASSLVGLRR